MVSIICPCTPVVGECDLGTAGIFLKQDTVTRPLAKRRPQNVWALTPNVAYNAARHTHSSPHKLSFGSLKSF